jgi:putative DNA primase/helicase
MKVMGIDIKGAMEAVAGVVGGCEKNPIPKSNPFTTPEEFRAMFNGSKIISPGDPAHRYLTSRGLTMIPEKLRYHPATWEKETKQNQKAMLGIFMNAANKAITLHRTYLDADGNKLQIEKPKKIMSCLPGERMPGGAIRLFPLDGRNVLGVAEGIETAIAAAEMFEIPVWSVTSAVMMEAFIVPPKVEQLHIFGDNDLSFTGQKAAYVLANKVAMQKKVNVNIHIPPPGDWLDVLGETGEK